MASTPLGALIPGQTGITQGPFGTQKVPRLPIIQFASGIEPMKSAR